MRFFDQYLKQIPIPELSAEDKQFLLKAANKLILLNSEKQVQNEQALELLRTEYKLSKVTQKLENFLQLNWSELVEELEKQKIKLNLTQKDELNTWFRGKQKATMTISETIQRLNAEIDVQVYRLYKLDEAEIGLIEKSILK